MEFTVLRTKRKYPENFQPAVSLRGNRIAGFATNFKSPFSSLKDVIRAFPKVRPNAKCGDEEGEIESEQMMRDYVGTQRC